MQGYKLTLAMVAFAVAPVAGAVWEGDTSAAWGTGSNWDTGTAPSGTSTTAEFNDTGIGSSSVTDTGTTRTIGSLTFSNTSGSYSVFSGGGNLKLATITNSSSASAGNFLIADIQNNTTNDAAASVTVTGNGTALLSITKLENQNSSRITRLVKNGTSALALTGTSTHTSTTTVNNGILRVTGDISSSSSLTVARDSGAGTFGTLEGAGTLPVTTINGVVAPGTASNVGALTSVGDISFGSLAVANFQIAGLTAGTFDLLQRSTADADAEAVTFGGTLNLLFTGTYSYGDSVKIFDFDSYSSDFTSLTFSGLGQDQSAQFNEATGVVTVVPEPASLSLLALGAGALLRRRR